MSPILPLIKPTPSLPNLSSIPLKESPSPTHFPSQHSLPITISIYPYPPINSSTKTISNYNPFKKKKKKIK
jgi:hypothetical protein